ncbi:MAG: FkbM family methyltransferase, partial [Chitinophagales bacterium]
MIKEKLQEQLNKVEYIARLSKPRRLLHAPLRYTEAIFFREVIYPWKKKEILKTVPVFFDKQMLVGLPAATDIFLTGGKSNESIIRLARFLINIFNDGDHFLDIGAHYGYFSLLASVLTSPSGKVYSFEPTSGTYHILALNADNTNISCFREAISDKPGSLTFFEFPNLYSEYNTTNANQFKNKKWYSDYNPIEITVIAQTIDNITASGFTPKVIKVDVAGAEYKVIRGGINYFTENSPLIIMEYLSTGRGNDEHRKASILLKNLGFTPHSIDNKGILRIIDNID